MNLNSSLRQAFLFGAEAKVNKRRFMNYQDRSDLAGVCGVSKWGEIPIEIRRQLEDQWQKGFENGNKSVSL